MATVDPQPPLRRRRSTREQARERILDAAVEAFADQGYEGTSLARIAEAVGLSQPGLLHHFPSKRALLTAVLDRRDDLNGRRVGLPGDVDGLAVLDVLVDLVRVNSAERGMVRAFSVLSGESVALDSPGRRHFADRYDRQRRELADLLQAGVDRGEIRADVDCTAVAIEIYALMDGLQLQWLHDRTAVDMVGLFTARVDRLRADLSAAPQA